MTIKKSYSLHMDANGEIELPLELLEAAGIKEGDSVLFSALGKGCIQMRRIPQALAEHGQEFSIPTVSEDAEDCLRSAPRSAIEI